VVEHRIQDPQVVELTEETEVVVAAPEGACLFCGQWIDGEETGVYALRLSRAEGDTRDFVSHVSCLAERADPAAKLP
jgi:hypothetical protein